MGNYEKLKLFVAVWTKRYEQVNQKITKKFMKLFIVKEARNKKSFSTSRYRPPLAGEKHTKKTLPSNFGENFHNKFPFHTWLLFESFREN